MFSTLDKDVSSFASSFTLPDTNSNDILYIFIYATPEPSKNSPIKLSKWLSIDDEDCHLFYKFHALLLSNQFKYHVSALKL